MTHELHASIRLTLPDDGKEQVAALAKATAEWAKLVHALDGGVVATFSVGAQPVGVKRKHRRVRPNEPPLFSGVAWPPAPPS